MGPHLNPRMALARSSSSFFSPSMDYHIPSAGSNWHHLISRWSDKGVTLPGAVVTPKSEDEILKALEYAASNRRKIIPGGGGHGTYVPIGRRTVYLNMKHFDTVTLDEESGTVTAGGGASTGQVLKTCAAKGYYTLVPNSNEIGMVGACLGGGSNIFNGLHGFSCDNIVSVSLITSSGNFLEVNEKSEGEEAALFRAICGGGHGLGVIVSITLRAFPIKDLKMDEDKIWTRKLIFPPESIDIAVQVYDKLCPPPPEMALVMGFTRAPAKSSQSGQPMIVLTVKYFGPAADAEKAAALTFSKAVTKAARSAETENVPVMNMNDSNDQLNRHGGQKELYACLTEGVTQASLRRSFARWLKLGEEVEDAKEHSYFIFSAWNTDKLIKNGESKPKNFFKSRQNGVLAQATVWYEHHETQGEADRFGQDLENIAEEEKLGPTAFANNMRIGMKIEEVYSKEQIDELRRLKDHWDLRSLFWSPAADGLIKPSRLSRASQVSPI